MYKLFWERPPKENLKPAGIDNILYPQGGYQPQRTINSVEALTIFYAISNTQYLKEVMGEFSPYEVIFHPQIYQEEFKGTNYYLHHAPMKNYFPIKDEAFENNVIWKKSGKEVFSIKKLSQVMGNRKFIEATLRRMSIGRGILEIDFLELFT